MHVLLHSLGFIDDQELFNRLFSPTELLSTFKSGFIKTPSKGIDRMNGGQFSKTAALVLTAASNKCTVGQYRFSGYLENLKTKGRNKSPRLIGIPVVRDRVILHQLNKYIAAIVPECVPKNVASTFVREISTHLPTLEEKKTWVCGVDIRTFYDDINRERLIGELSKRIKSQEAISLIQHALATPTIPKNSTRKQYRQYKTTKGVPQGLAISNILASIYMQGIDEPMHKLGITYYRYVDDVLMYGDKEALTFALRSLRARLGRRGLALHPESSGKSHFQPLSTPFSYLGYAFKWPAITVRDITIERFLQSIAAKFSDFSHNKKRRMDRFKFLTEEIVKDIFLMELNERITGAISKNRRYGWVAYFNQINDLSLLHRLDHAIAKMFKRLPEFGHTAPAGLRKLSRSYFEMKFNPKGNYVRDYDKIETRAQKLAFLQERGRIGPTEALTDEQINDRFEQYREQVLSAMHSDEGVLYG